MCNPSAITAIGVAGTAASAIGAETGAKAQQNYYNYLAAQNEAQAESVAKTADINAGLVAGAAAREDLNLSHSVATVEGAQKAAGAASGVYAGSKTSEDIARDTATKAELDRAAIRQNADLQTRKIALEATGQEAALRSQAAGFRMAGENARTAGRLGVASSILGGATRVASNWYQWGQLKGKPPAAADPYADAL